MSSYTTLVPGAEVTAELERRRSRFLAVMRHTGSADEAEGLLTELRRSHHEARHHCSAWVIGPERAVRRGQDDGEPSGTAGAPMLEVLTHTTMPSGRADLTDVAVVVVRWFGGTLLGAGGLVSAYSDATTEVLRAAAEGDSLQRRRRLRRYSVLAPIAEVGRWENELRGQGVTVDETDYAVAEPFAGEPAARLHLAAPDTDHGALGLRTVLAELSAGSAEPHPGEPIWAPAAWTDGP